RYHTTIPAADRPDPKAWTEAVHFALPTVPTPPVAKKVPKVDVVHGDRRQDDYAWLRHRDDPDVLAYLRAENAYADLVMTPTAPFQAALYAEMLGRIKEDDTTVPYRRGNHFYYSRTEKGKQYPNLCRKHGSLEAPEEITLDLIRLAEGHAFLALGAYAVSDDGRRLVYTVDVTGSREYTLYVKDLQTGALEPDRVGRVASVGWWRSPRRGTGTSTGWITAVTSSMSVRTAAGGATSGSSRRPWPTRGPSAGPSWSRTARPSCSRAWTCSRTTTSCRSVRTGSCACA